jgi:hypothetical protein
MGRRSRGGFHVAPFQPVYESTCHGAARGHQPLASGHRVRSRPARSSTPTRISCRRWATRWPRSRAASQHVRHAGGARRRGLQAVLDRSRPRRVLARAVSARRQGRQGDLDPGELQPDPGRGGKPVGVVKYAFDITEQKNRLADLEGQQQPRSDKAQAVIEFDLTGKILHANENFLAVLGYSLPEIVGQHHRMFVDPAERESAAIGSSGSGSGTANTMPRNTAASARAARRSGFRRATTRSSTPRAAPTRS